MQSENARAQGCGQAVRCFGGCLEIMSERLGAVDSCCACQYALHYVWAKSRCRYMRMCHVPSCSKVIFSQIFPGRFVISISENLYLVKEPVLNSKFSLLRLPADAYKCVARVGGKEGRKERPGRTEVSQGGRGGMMYTQCAGSTSSWIQKGVDRPAGWLMSGCGVPF